MTQVYDKEGRLIPVTVIEAGPCVVNQVKTMEKDGYRAVQIGFMKQKKKEKPLHLKEFKADKVEGIVKGQEFKVDIFAEGERIKVSGTSIGKGTQGTVKRHHFHRGDMAHGSKFHRLPGSIGAGTTPGRVLKGMRMAGRMGNEAVSQKNVLIVKIDLEKNMILLKGAVPGCDNAIVVLNKGKKNG